jgi:DNA-binding SARP family transcriptional activator
MIPDSGGLQFLCEAADACAAVGAEAPSARLLAAAREHRIEDPVTVALTEAFIDARRGKPEAAEVLQRMLEECEIAPWQQWKAELLTGYVRHAAGRIDAADQRMLIALDRAASLGHPDLPDRREPRVVGVLRSAIRLAPAVVTGTETEAVAPAGRYEVRVLGGFEVRQGPEVLQGTGRASQLVKHLVLAGGSVRVETMVEMLWPGEMPGVGQRRLKNVLTRARATYGSLVTRTGGMLCLAPCKVDLHAFEDLARAVAAAQHEERVSRARLALAAFTRLLLPDDLYCDRIAKRREVVRRRVLGLVDVVLSAALEAGDVEEAMDRLETAMDLDPYDQERPLRVARSLVAGRRYLEAGDLAARVIAAANELGLPFAVEWEELSLSPLDEAPTTRAAAPPAPRTTSRGGRPAADGFPPEARRSRR